MLAIVDKARGVRTRGEPLSVRAARLLRTDIMNGKLRLGERLVETELAAAYNVRRHVLREALQVLEGEGLVVSDAFCGRSVFHPDPQQIEGLLLLRASLESAAAALAAYRMTPANAKLLREAATVPSGGFPNASHLYDWDARIHRVIWSIASQPLLCRELERSVLPFMILTPKLAGQHEDVHEMIRQQILVEQSPDDPSSHNFLVAAICSGDSQRARHAMVEHLSCARYFSNEMRTLLTVALSGS